MEPLSRDEVAIVLDIVADDLERIEKLLTEASTAGTPFLTETASYLTRAGGKRLRPALVALSARMWSECGPDADATAAAIELTHLATLYHDDVIDEADVRRGVPSANNKWGNTVAILVGDYLFARASSIAADVGGQVPRILADAIARVVQGQVRELEHLYDIRRTAAHYFATVDDKTGALLEASSRLGAALAGATPEQSEELRRFGSAFGTAFQIADDLLDFSASQDELGKAPGTDLRDGVYTLPLLYAVEAEPSLVEALGTPEPDIDLIRAAVVRTGAFERALAVAADHVDQALAALNGAPGGTAREALEALTRLIIDRVPVLE
jgi:heptaprenyl diphosphate synthase